MVIGIIGNTHGVKMEARPNPNATSMNAPNPSAGTLETLGDGGGACASTYPAGIVKPARAAAGSTVNVAVPVHFEGTHIFGLQV